jgi:hypothetical protein
MLTERLVPHRFGEPVSDDEEFEIRERGANGAERPLGDGDLEVLVLTCLASTKQVECPARRHVPRNVHPGETTCGLRGMPGLPEREIGLERVCSQAQIQRRQR